MIIRDEGIKNKERFENMAPFTVEEAKKAMDFVVLKAREGLSEFTDKFPAAASKNLIYPATENIGWTTGFWTGILWLCYQYTGDEEFKKAAELQCKSFKKRIEEHYAVDHHDMGFLYSPSCVEGYKLTLDKDMKDAAIMAADNLISRYHEKGEFIQAWGPLDEAESYRLIIDCMNNIPLLFWASEVTGDDKYREIAIKHANTSANNVIREDSSTYHTFYFDINTGAPLKGVTAQGYSDDSAWARGQAWGVSGFPIAYAYTKNPVYTEIAQKLTNFFLNRLPGDYVPYWDLIFGDGSGEERDSSAAAIAVCGMLELNSLITCEYTGVYKNAVSAIMRSLTENYTAKNCNSNGILLHAVYGKPQGNGVDECNIWGDYYYAEALMRIIDPSFKLCW